MTSQMTGPNQQDRSEVKHTNERFRDKINFRKVIAGAGAAALGLAGLRYGIRPFWRDNDSMTFVRRTGAIVGGTSGSALLASYAVDRVSDVMQGDVQIPVINRSVPKRGVLGAGLVTGLVMYFGASTRIHETSAESVASPPASSVPAPRATPRPTQTTVEGQGGSDTAAQAPVIITEEGETGPGACRYIAPIPSTRQPSDELKQAVVNFETRLQAAGLFDGDPTLGNAGGELKEDVDTLQMMAGYSEGLAEKAKWGPFTCWAVAQNVEGFGDFWDPQGTPVLVAENR